jgi:hypothetical protein
LLGIYARTPEYPAAILRALETRLTRPLKTQGEELAAMRLADDLLPESFDAVAALMLRQSHYVELLKWRLVLLNIKSLVPKDLEQQIASGVPELLVDPGDERVLVIKDLSEGLCAGKNDVLSKLGLLADTALFGKRLCPPLSWKLQRVQAPLQLLMLFPMLSQRLRYLR